jgi:peroxiredoxin
MKKWLFFFTIGLIISCNKKQRFNTVILHYKSHVPGKILLERIACGDEKTQVTDSAILDTRSDKIVFKIPWQEQRVFRLRIRDNPARVYFINDIAAVDIYTRNNDLSQYYYNEGSINNRVGRFIGEQKLLESKINKLAIVKDSLQLFKNKRAVDSVSKLIDSFQTIVQGRDIVFTDTTKSAGAFLYLYSRIDFRKNYQGLKKYITNAGGRFPGHACVGRLVHETLDYIRIFEEEYSVGDQMPDLTLPDQHDNSVSISSQKGKFLFIDFWATWCPQCLEFIEPKRKMKQQFPASKFETISIALDVEKDTWRQMIHHARLEGVQLLDEQMWRGRAAGTFKIDSIPFNFLISPEGKILAKAIKKEDVLQTVSKFIK